MTMPICNGCGSVELTPEFDSEAHIIPNALGGRLSPRGLICRECNTLLDRLADNPLIRAFGPWPTLLDIPRHRGKNPPVEIDTADGQRVSVDPDGTTTRVDVIYDVTPIDADSHKVHVGAGNWKVVRQLIGRATKQFPQLDAVQAASHAQKVKMPATAQWRIGTNFAPANVFPGAFAAFWLFFLHKTGHKLAPWDRVLEVVDNVRQGGTFRYFPSPLPGLSGPDIDLSHKIILRTVPATGLLIGYLEILGTLRVGGIVAQGAPGSELEYIYVADVLTKRDRSGEFSIDPKAFDATDWKTIGLGLSDVAEIKTYIENAQIPLQKRWESLLAQGA
jgi:hypothetical protein